MAEAGGGYKITLCLRGFTEPRNEDNNMGGEPARKEGPAVTSFNLHTDN